MSRLFPAILSVAILLSPAVAYARPAGSQFTVVATVRTQGTVTTLQVHTRIGATCTASVLYDNGATIALAPQSQHVSTGGIVRWAWHARGGMATASAACLWSGQVRIGLARFFVGPARPPAAGPSIAPSGATLLAISGKNPSDSKTDSALFKATGTFRIHYTTAPIDTSAYSGGSLFMITVESPDKSVYDMVVSAVADTGKPTPNGTAVLRSDDCSRGCFLEVEAANLSYTIQVTS